MKEGLAFKGGLYKITYTNTGDFYIGSTREFARRKTKHFSELKRGAHSNLRLQRIYDKYGKSALEFSILVVCQVEDRTFLYELEQLAIDVYQPKLNGTKIVARPTAPSKPVAKYDLHGRFVTAYPSIKEAAKDCNIHVNSIQDVIAGRSLTSSNHFWMLLDESGNYGVLPKHILSCWRNSNSYTRKSCNPINQYFKDGRFIKQWENLEQISKELSINKAYLRKHLTNPKSAPTCRGFKFVELK